MEILPGGGLAGTPHKRRGRGVGQGTPSPLNLFAPPYSKACPRVRHSGKKPSQSLFPLRSVSHYPGGGPVTFSHSPKTLKNTEKWGFSKSKRRYRLAFGQKVRGHF